MEDASLAPKTLAGLRVVELGEGQAAYCGKLLADLGAEVVKVEGPSGGSERDFPPFVSDPDGAKRSIPFLYMNTNKRGVTLDLRCEKDAAALGRLVLASDVVIESFAPGYLEKLGVGYSQLSAHNPALVFTSISGFGQSGPHRDYSSCDIVAAALGGSMHVVGYGEDPPLRLAGSQSDIMAATCAAASTLIALYHARVSGRGQHVDISSQEVTASVAHICGAGKYLDDGIVPRRMGTGLFASVPSGTYRCKDGMIYLMINRPRHWQALARWVSEVSGNREILDPMFEGPSSKRLEHRELLDIFIGEMTAQLSVAAVYHEGQRRHITVSPVSTAADVVANPQLAARGYFVDFPHKGERTLRYPGAPYRHSLTPWSLRRPAPCLGEHSQEVFGVDLEPHSGDGDLGAVTLRAATAEPRKAAPSQTASTQALGGLRVLEFSAGMAGPWIGRFMAWCGAEVIRVESHSRPDVSRLYVSPRHPELGIQPEMSPWFTDWNAGKRLVALDLDKPDGVELAKRLAASCDVVIENYSCGVIGKLGLGWEVLSESRNDLIMLSTSGYGESGPQRDYISWGPNLEALSGLAWLSGYQHRSCTMTQYAYPDSLSALHGLFAIMSALEHRRVSGAGQYINLSQFEASAAVIGVELMQQLCGQCPPQRLGNGSMHAAPHGCYPCKGADRWCAIAVFGEQQWRALCKVAGHDEWASDPRFASLSKRLANLAELDRVIGEWSRCMDAYQLMHSLQSAGVAAGVVQSIEDMLHRDPHLAARSYFEQITHLKKGRVVANGIPLGLTATPGATSESGASIGQHNDYVFGKLLGLSREEIAGYIASGAIESGP